MANQLPSGTHLGNDGELHLALERAYELVFKGPVEFFTLKAGMDLDLFSLLAAGPLSLTALAEATGTRPERLQRLLLAMELIGLVEQAADQWRLTPFATQFFTAPEQHRNLTMLPFMEYMSSQVLAYYSDLAEVTRGKRDFTSHVPYPPRTVDDSHFYETIHRSNTYFVQRLLCEQARLAGVTRLIDVGGGIGDIAVSLCKQHPQLSVTLINLPTAVELIDRNVAAEGLEGRITPQVLDMYRDPYPEGDAILFSRILYPMNPQLSTLMIQKAFDALASGGRVLIIDMIISDRSRPNYDYLSHYLCAVGMDFSVLDFKDHAIYPELLGSVGFRDVSLYEDYGYVLYQAVKP